MSDSQFNADELNATDCTDKQFIQDASQSSEKDDTIKKTDKCHAEKMEHPSWLDKEFFETVLRTYEEDDTIMVERLKFTHGADKGDHFASVIFRVVAEYSSSSNDTNSRSMIVKTLPEVEGFKKEFLEKSHIFQTEIDMYSIELPKFEDALRKHGDNTQLCAKMLYHSLTPRQVIVFEDLVQLGYACIRDRSINIDEAKVCLSKLAKIHAVSYKLAMEGDESVKKYEDGLLAEPKEDLPDFITGGFQRLIDAISKVKGFEIYIDKLKAIESTLMDKCNDIFNAYKRGQKALMVLNHGDLHTRNVMFKFGQDASTEDVMLIDYQYSCYAPAVIDITYSIFMLLDQDLRQNHSTEIINFYFTIFLATLKNIEYDGEPPTLANFYTDMHRFKEFELWVMSTFLPMFYGGGESFEMEDMISSSDLLHSRYLNPDFLYELKLLLQRYLHNGYLG